MVDISSTGYAKLDRLRTISNVALNNNPYERAIMASPPTVTVSATTDGTLAAAVPFVSGAALTSAAINKVAWYGGVPSPYAAINYVCMPVTSVLPSVNGNLAAGANSSGVTADMNAWSHAMEVMTDATTIEFCLFTNNVKKTFIQVDGQYVDFTGVTGTGTTADNFIKLAFASRKVRRIRITGSSLNSNANTVLYKQIRVAATCDFWKPSMQDVIRVGFCGDSYAEGTNGAGTTYPVSNAAWPVLACELLGFRDCRQLAVGATGYLADNGGLRSTFRNQIPRFSAQAPFDLLIVGHGYNDYASSPSAVTTEATLALQALRAANVGVPIVVLGAQAGTKGPDATLIAIENAISAAVTAVNDPLCKFHPVSTDTTTWLNGTGKVGATNGSGNSDVYIDPDGIHPAGPLAGEEYLAYRTAKSVRTALAAMG